MISVIMGVFNCESTVEEAVQSIQKQTIAEWELIICDDGSTDNTYPIVRHLSLQDSRIVLLKNACNMGLNYTLNRCLEVAQGEYIARMDGDDVCSSTRLEKELLALESRPEIAIISTDMDFFDEYGKWGKTSLKEYPQPSSLIKSTPFCHAACMVRKEAFQAVGGYSVGKRFLRVEDYHLWVKMYAKGYRGMNIQEPLYQMRDDRNALKRKLFIYRINEAYVKAIAIRELRLSKWKYIYCLRPILIGLMPRGVYNYFHRLVRFSQ